MKKVKVAFIGAGNLANAVHYPSVVALEDVEIVALCDLDEARRKSTAEKFKVPRTYASHKQMMAEVNPDAVYALMPPHVLFDVAMDVLEAGKHMFIEKPPAVTTFQTDCLARAAERKGVCTAVGFQRRYHPLFLRCWEEVKKRGRVHQVVSTFHKCMPPSEAYPYYRGAIDILHCDAIHAVDALRFYAGLADVKSVSSVVETVDAWYNTSFNALVSFANGCVGVLSCNWRSGRRILKMEYHGCNACAEADADGAGMVWAGGDAKPVLQSTFTEAGGSSAGNVAQGFLGESRAFIDAVKDGRQVHNNLRDAVKSMDLVDRIYASAARPG